MDSAEYNITQQEIDAFQDTSREALREYEENMVHLVLSYSRIVTEIVKLILCLIVIVFDIFLIHVLSKFKKFKCQTNSYIMHYAIINIVHLLDTPIFYIMVDLLAFPRFFSPECMSVIRQFENATFLLGFLFAFGLGFDWLIMCYKPTIGKINSNISKNFIWIMYIFSFILFLAHSLLCYFGFERSHVVIVMYVLILIFIIILNFLCCKNSVSKTNISHSLTIANIIVFSWLPTFIYHNLLIFASNEEIFRYILLFTEFIPEAIAYSNPIVIIFMLGRLNKHFKVAYQKVMKKAVANSSNKEDNLDESEGVDNTTSNTYISNCDADVITFI